MGVKSQQPVVDREKEIQRYLQRMERVLTQAERMHSSTHVQPARRRHSLSNSQESLKVVIGSAPDDSSHPSSPEAPSPSCMHALPAQQPNGAAQAQGSRHFFRLKTSPQKQRSTKSLSMDPGDLLRQTARETGGLLDTSATLADWIMRSTSSSAGASQRESDEVAELAAEMAAVPADVAYSSLLLESLPEWALKPGDGSSTRVAPGQFPRHRSPVSFPVTLSESASLSRATSSPEQPRRASHAGRTSASFSRAATSACKSSDTEDTADSGSPQDQHQSCGDSGPQRGLRVLQEGKAGTHMRQKPGPAKPGSIEGSNASAAKPRHRASSHKPGASLQDSGLRAHTEKRAMSESGSPKKPSSRGMQRAADHPAQPPAGESGAMELDARQDACRGSDEPATQQQPAAALQKLKLRVRSRHRTSSQGMELQVPFESTEGWLPLATEAAPHMAPAAAQLLATEKHAANLLQDGGEAAAGPARSARTGIEAVPAEEQVVFRAFRTLPRSPLKGTPQLSAQRLSAKSPITPAKTDAASTCDNIPYHMGKPAEQAQPECTAHTTTPGGSIGMGWAGALIDHSRSQCCSSITPDLTPSPQQQPESSPGSGVLARDSLAVPAVSKVLRSTAGEETAIFTPSHKLARSPVRQLDPLVMTHEDLGSQLSPYGFPQDPKAEELPETPRMRAAAQYPCEKRDGTRASTQAADSYAQRGDHWKEDNALAQKTASPDHVDDVRAAGLPNLRVLDCDQPVQGRLAEQKEVGYGTSPRHAGVAPSRLPRPPSATSPQPGSKWPPSGGASKLPSAPAGPPTAQGGQPTNGSAFHSREALQQTEQLLGRAAVSVQATRRPQEAQRRPFETSFNASILPGRQGKAGDTAENAAGHSSMGEGMPDTAGSSAAPRTEEQTPDKARRCSFTGAPAPVSASPTIRPRTSPAAGEAAERQLSNRLRAKQHLSGSPPEKTPMRRRLSLGAPQRIRSPAPDLEAPGNYGTTKPAAKSVSADAARPKGADSPTRPRLQRSHTPERSSARTSSRLQGTAGGAHRSRTQASTGRDTVLSAVGKLPIDVIMSSMHGALMD